MASGKRGTHPGDGVLDEPAWVDVGVVVDDVAGELVEDLFAPSDVEGVEGGEGQEQVA